MRCPECNTKLSTKHYDAVYSWYECPSCEGAFTVDEIEEARNAKPSRKPKGNSGRKASGSGGAQRKNASRKNGKAQEGDAEIRERITRSGPVAKGKKRRTEIQEDEEAVAKYEEEILKPVKRVQEKHHRDELDTAQVLGVWQDEIQAIYEENGIHLDEANARDKALIIWREIHIKGITAREQTVEHVLCGDHE